MADLMSKQAVSLPSLQQAEIRSPSLVTSDTFSVDVGVSATSVYNAREDSFFRFLKISAVNTTGGVIVLEILVDGDVWFTGSIAANSTDPLAGFSDQAVAPGAAVTATGDGLRLVGWGVSAQGGEEWFL